MPGLSNYAEEKLIDHQYRTAAWNPPGTGHIFLAAPDPDEAGAFNEISGGGYARVAITAIDANWTAPAIDGAVDGLGRQRYKVSNTNAATFGAPNAPWIGSNPITHWGYADAASDGNKLFYAPLAASKIIIPGGAAPEFAPGDLVLSLASRSAYATIAILNHLLRSTKMAKPTSIKYALMALVASAWQEVSGGGYGQIVVPVGDESFAAPVGGNGQTSNLAALLWSTPSSPWGELCGVRALDQAGNVLHEQPMAQTVYVNTNDRAPRIPAGGWVYGLD